MFKIKATNRHSYRTQSHLIDKQTQQQKNFLSFRNLERFTDQTQNNQQSTDDLVHVLFSIIIPNTTP